MKTFIQILFFFLMVTQICFAQWESSSSESKSNYPSLELSNFSFDIDSLITITMNNYHIPGLSACLVRDGELIWKGAYGYAIHLRIISRLQTQHYSALLHYPNRLPGLL